ncbi:MAG: hypothetical protein ACT4QE_03590 [Anaerolineales bacterium]
MLRHERAMQLAVAASGVLYVFTGLALLFAPEWFFENIGHFPPFNRHFMGDIGAFTLPLGLGLLLAARAPQQHRLFIGVVALGSFIHLANHLYDDVLASAWSLEHFLVKTLPLTLVAVALTWVAADGLQRRQHG